MNVASGNVILKCMIYPVCVVFLVCFVMFLYNEGSGENREVVR